MLAYLILHHVDWSDNTEFIAYLRNGGFRNIQFVATSQWSKLHVPYIVPSKPSTVQKVESPPFFYSMLIVSGKL